MAVQIVNRAQALMPGCDLWVIPSESISPLIKKIDWYLNFQLSRAEIHHREELSPEMKSIMHENELPTFYSKPEDQLPLMVLSEERLPVKTVVQMRDMNSKLEWTEFVHNLWQGLNCPTLRVFLPINMTPDEFKSTWPGMTKDDVFVVSTKK